MSKDKSRLEDALSLLLADNLLHKTLRVLPPSLPPSSLEEGGRAGGKAGGRKKKISYYSLASPVTLMSDPPWDVALRPTHAMTYLELIFVKK